MLRSRATCDQFPIRLQQSPIMEMSSIVFTFQVTSAQTEALISDRHDPEALAPVMIPTATSHSII